MTEFVARPKQAYHAVPQATYDALLATSENGLSVRVPREGRTRQLQNTLRRWVRARGYRFHYTAADDALICWVESTKEIPQ